MTHTRNFADLSSNNGPGALDGPAYARAGHVLLAVKATDGTGYVNPDWAGQVREAHAAGVGVLHYHFAERAGAPAVQAAAFVHTVSAEFNWRSDGICLDLEREQNVQNPLAFKHEFDLRCIAAGHRNMVVYSEES